MRNHITLLLLFLIISVSAAAQDGNKNSFDADGKKHGAWAVDYPNNPDDPDSPKDQPRYSGQFDHGKPIGVFFYYYETGEKSSQVEHIEGKGSDASHATFFHKNGTIMGEGDYQNGVKNGTWKFFDNQAILSSEEPYKNGKIDGLMKVYHQNGKLAAEIPYVDGLKNGPFKEYAPSGDVLIEGTYADNTFDGEYKQYFEGGQIYMEGKYRAAVKDGLWMYYADDGRVKAQQVYNKGKLVKDKIEEGFEIKEFKEKLEEDDIIDEDKAVDDFMNGRPVGGR